jgi:hypothetical protein
VRGRFCHQCIAVDFAFVVAVPFRIRGPGCGDEVVHGGTCACEHVENSIDWTVEAFVSMVIVSTTAVMTMA